MMVAQDARKGRRVLDRLGPSGGANTLRPVRGCVIPVLGRVLRDGFETWSSRGVERYLGCMTWVLEVPLPPLYIRGAGLQGRFPSRLRVGVLGLVCLSFLSVKSWLIAGDF